MAVRYIADLHFDYGDIIAYDDRPFDSVEMMNEAMIKAWNGAVSAGDETWILGDFCSGDGTRWRELLSRLNGKKRLIIGNHDAPGAVKAAADLFEETAEYKEIEDEGRHVVLCHYPIISFHNHYFGWYHLYGHVHTGYEHNVTENGKRLLRQLYVRDDVCRMANVGAMLPFMNYAPKTLDELIKGGTI